MRSLLGLVALLLIGHGPAGAAEGPPPPPLVSIIIDDLGDQRRLGEQAVALPGPVTCAFLPLTPFARELAERAYRLGKEVMLHLPMQAVEDRPLGPGALRLDMTETQFREALGRALAAVPHVRGVNNHMGSLLTRHPGHMDWLMGELARRGSLYFVDSRTTRATVAHKVAREYGLPTRRRDVFLDHSPEPAAIHRQFDRLLARAERHGAALGIGHPYPSTLEVLRERLPDLAARGVRLVPVSELIAATQQRSAETWRLSLSP